MNDGCSVRKLSNEKKVTSLWEMVSVPTYSLELVKGCTYVYHVASLVPQAYHAHIGGNCLCSDVTHSVEALDKTKKIRSIVQFSFCLAIAQLNFGIFFLMKNTRTLDTPYIIYGYTAWSQCTFRALA